VHRNYSTGSMKTKTISKGYRLKPSTHDLIEKVQQKLKCSKDAVLSEAVRLLYKTYKENNINKFNK
jgi:hypothetical protein